MRDIELAIKKIDISNIRKHVADIDCVMGEIPNYTWNILRLEREKLVETINSLINK